MISLLLFDVQIGGVAILTLLFFAFSLWKTQTGSPRSPALASLAASGGTTAADGPWSSGGAGPAAGHGHAAAHEGLAGRSAPALERCEPGSFRACV